MCFNFSKKNTKLNDETILQKRNFDQVINQFNLSNAPKSFWGKYSYGIYTFTAVAIIIPAVFLYNFKKTKSDFTKIETKEKQLILKVESINELQPIVIQSTDHKISSKPKVVEEKPISITNIEKNESALETQTTKAKKMNFAYRNQSVEEDVVIEQNTVVTVLINSIDINNNLKDIQVKNWTVVTLKEIPDNQIVKTILAVNDEITEFKGNILDGNARRLVLKAKGNDEIILKVKYIDKEGVEKEFQINKKVQTTKSSF
jgi:hypothetical protein